MPRRKPNEEEGDSKRYWQSKGEERSQLIYVSFVIVIVLMLVVVVSMGAYGYYSWQEWKRGPQIRVEEGLFEFRVNEVDEKADITVHLSLINQGERDSGDIKLEWLVMERRDVNNNLLLENGSASIAPITSESTRKEAFDISLSQGDYVIAYRVYDDQLFSYEARQNIFVRQDDVSSESPDTVSVPEFSQLILPIIVVLLLFIVYRRRYHDR